MPSLSTVSGDMAPLLAIPRTPSVPKYLRIIQSSMLLQVDEQLHRSASHFDQALAVHERLLDLAKHRFETSQQIGTGGIAVS